MSKNKEVAGAKQPARTVAFYKISPENFKVMDSKLSILNPETLQYLQVIFNMTIEAVYDEEGRPDSKE